MIQIDKSRACAVSGHRNLSLDFSTQKLKETFIELINSGVDTFLVGMAIGFDAKCFTVLEQLRPIYNIKIVACVPCEEQDKNFSIAQKKEYERMLLNATEVILVSKNYTKGCMLKRNRFMIDNSDYLVCYLREQSGGTAYTVKYASQTNKKIIYV